MDLDKLNNAESTDRTPLVGRKENGADLKSNYDEAQYPQKAAGSLWRDTTCSQKILLILILWAQFTVFVCLSTPVPFMTNAIIAKGGLATESSILLQSTMLMMAISSIVFGKYQAYFGNKPMLLGGLFLFGVCQAILGVLAYIENIAVLVAVGIIIKAFQGVTQGAFVVASLTVVCQEFTDHVGQAYGLTESLSAVGYIAGPMLGGALYSISNDMLLPFVVSGALIFPLIPLGMYMFKNYEAIEQNSEIIDITSIIRNPASVLLLIVVATDYGVMGLFDILGTVYLKSQGFNVVEIGSALLTAAGCYAVSSIMSGYVSSIGIKSRRALFSVGCVGLVFSQFVYMPFPLPKGVLYASFGLYGILCAFMMICGFGELVYLSAKDRPDLKDSFALHSALSGVWTVAFGAGGFILPLIGSPLVNVLTFSHTTMTCITLGICLGAVVALLMVVWRYCRSS